MAQMKKRNAQLVSVIGRIPDRETIKEVQSLPEPDTVNIEGHEAYGLDDALQLLSLLNTSKLKAQFYASENSVITRLKELVWKVADRDPYLAAQCIVWSRCCGEGMRTVNHLAAVMLAPFISGREWARRFYGPFNKTSRNSGGCVYRLDDMSGMKDAFAALNGKGVVLTNAMKKGFATALERASAYELVKYRKATIDIARLTHPNVSRSATVDIEGVEHFVIDALFNGLFVSADTWEAANSEAGQVVAEAVRNGSLSYGEAEVVLKEAKNDNWESLLKDGKLGILAAIRNLRNILEGDRDSVIDSVAALVSDGTRIRDGKVMPYQLELAADAVRGMADGMNARKILGALESGMISALPNLGNLCKGRNVVLLDCSGSMCSHPTGTKNLQETCIQKAAIIAAMIAKATGADIIRFGTRARYVSYDPNDGLFALAEKLGNTNCGGTDIGSAFWLMTEKRKAYDRVFLLSDNECNRGCTRREYGRYVSQVCSPYIYCVDLASYGTVPMRNDGKVNYYFGYGYAMFDDIARLEFNPSAHIDKVRRIKI